MRMDQGGHCHVNGSFPVQNNHFRKVRHIADALTVVPPFNMWKQSPAFLDITFGPIPSSIWHDRSSLIITNYLRRVEKRPSWSFTALGALWVGDLRFLLLETATVAWWAGQVQDPLEQFVLFLWDVQRHLKFFDVLWALKPCIWMHMNACDIILDIILDHILKSSTFSKLAESCFSFGSWSFAFVLAMHKDHQTPRHQKCQSQLLIRNKYCLWFAFVLLGQNAIGMGRLKHVAGGSSERHSDTHSPIGDLISCSAQVCRFHVCNLSAAWPVMSHELFIAFDWRSIPAYHRCFIVRWYQVSLMSP